MWCAHHRCLEHALPLVECETGTVQAVRSHVPCACASSLCVPGEVWRASKGGDMGCSLQWPAHHRSVAVAVQCCRLIAVFFWTGSGFSTLGVFDLPLSRPQRHISLFHSICYPAQPCTLYMGTEVRLEQTECALGPQPLPLLCLFEDHGCCLIFTTVQKFRPDPTIDGT
jgi:hypothetical protein